MIGFPGKWPAQSSSVTVLRATTRSPGTSSSTSSTSRKGSRCGRMSSISRLPSTVLFDGRKVGEVLAEAAARVALGVGVNVGAAPSAGGAAAEAGRLELFLEILERLERGYAAWVRSR